MNGASERPFCLPCGSIYRTTVIPTDSGMLWAIRNDPSPKSTLLSLRNGDSETTATRILSSPIFSILNGFLQGFGGAARRGCARLCSAGPRALPENTMETDENSDSDGADGLFNLRRVWAIGGFLPADCQCVCLMSENSRAVQAQDSGPEL